MISLAPELSPFGWFTFAASTVLMLTYVYFWWMVIKATAHRHVSRTRMTNRLLTAAVDEAVMHGHVARYLIQITTKGGALSVVERGIDNVMAAVERFPVLSGILWVEVITELEVEQSALTAKYSESRVPVVAYLLPPEYSTPRGTRLKARALEYMVDLHRSAPQECYVVHFDEESVYTPENLARLVHRLSTHPVGISEGMISYGLDWDDATLFNKAMESNRPFGCHECYSVMTSPPPMHVHGSNLVIRQDLENAIGWDIGTLDGSALIAEDLVFGLAAYLKFGQEAFGWHHAEMIEQPPFTLKAAYKQRERWVFGALQALAQVRKQKEWLLLTRRDRWHISVIIRVRVLTYALGFPVSLLALGTNAVEFAVWAGDALVRGQAELSQPPLTIYSIVSAIGFTLWMGGTQLGLFYNLRYSGLSLLQKLRDHVLVLLVTPFAGVVDTAGPLVAVIKWYSGVREVAWKPTPKLSASSGRGRQPITAELSGSVSASSLAELMTTPQRGQG